MKTLGKKVAITVATAVAFEVTVGVMRGLKVKETIAAKIEQIMNGDD